MHAPAPRAALLALVLLALALLGSVALPGPAWAQPAPAPARTVSEEALAAARELIEASDAMRQFDEGVTSMMQVLAHTTARNSGTTPARTLEIFRTVLLPEIRGRLPEVREFFALSWARHLSTDELRQLATFYRSPLGTRLREVTPAVSAEGMAFGASWGQRVAAEAIDKHREALRARGLKI